MPDSLKNFVFKFKSKTFIVSAFWKFWLHDSVQRKPNPKLAWLLLARINIVNFLWSSSPFIGQNTQTKKIQQSKTFWWKVWKIYQKRDVLGF